MSILAATCATLAATLAAAQPGDTVALKGNCERVVIANRFAAPVTLDARKAAIKGLQLRGSNLILRGGVFAARAGMDGFAYDGYAIDIRNASGIRITGALVTSAKKGIVLADARNIVIEDSRFWRLREDGIIATRTENLDIDRNSFTEFAPRKTRCTLPGGTVQWGTPKRDCKGAFVDGNHADGVQFYNAMVNVRVRWNTVVGDMQGIGEFGGAGDVVSRRVLIEGNTVTGSQGHQITLYECIECVIKGNTVRRGGTWKAIIRPGTAKRCENDVQDQKRDGAC